MKYFKNIVFRKNSVQSHILFTMFRIGKYILLTSWLYMCCQPLQFWFGYFGYYCTKRKQLPENCWSSRLKSSDESQLTFPRACHLHLRDLRISQARELCEACSRCHLNHTGFLIGLFLYPEDLGDMSVDFQWTIWHIPEDGTLHNHWCENFRYEAENLIWGQDFSWNFKISHS
jgi:hypothetical protein